MLRPARLSRQLCLSLGLLAAAVGCGKRSDPFPYAFTSAQRTAVEALLARAAGWQLATAADHTSKWLDTLRRTEPSFEPYFAQGDLTGDGVADFALVLRRDSSMRVYVFRGEGARFAPPELLAEYGQIRNDVLMMRDGALAVGPLYSDAGDIFAWDRRTGTFGMRPMLDEEEVEREIDAYRDSAARGDPTARDRARPTVGPVDAPADSLRADTTGRDSSARSALWR